MVPEEESTTANKAAVGSTVLASEEEQRNPTEHKKLALGNDNMEGETSPPPDVTPTKDLEIVNNIDLNETGTEMVTDNNQDSAPDSFKHPEINRVVNPLLPLQKMALKRFLGPQGEEHILQGTKNLTKTHLWMVCLRNLRKSNIKRIL